MWKCLRQVRDISGHLWLMISRQNHKKYVNLYLNTDQHGLTKYFQFPILAISKPIILLRWQWTAVSHFSTQKIYSFIFAGIDWYFTLHLPFPMKIKEINPRTEIILCILAFYSRYSLQYEKPVKSTVTTSQQHFKWICNIIYKICYPIICKDLKYQIARKLVTCNDKIYIW